MGTEVTTRRPSKLLDALTLHRPKFHKSKRAFAAFSYSVSTSSLIKDEKNNSHSCCSRELSSDTSEPDLSQGSRLATRIFDQLRVPDTELKSWKDNRCDVCSTNANQLKNEALSMVQTLEDSRLLVANIPRIAATSSDQLFNKRHAGPVANPSSVGAESYYNHSVNFPPRYGYMAYGHDAGHIQQVPLSVFASLWKTNMSDYAGNVSAGQSSLQNTDYTLPEVAAYYAKGNDTLEIGRDSVLEAECFAELSQALLVLFQLNIEEKRAAHKLKKKQKKAAEKSQQRQPDIMTATNPTSSSDNVTPELSIYPTKFCDAVRRYPPPSPPGLIKGLTKRKSTGGKSRKDFRDMDPPAANRADSFY